MMKSAILVLAVIAFLAEAQAESSLFENEQPLLLALTITDFEDTGIGDFHSTWYVYEAEIAIVIAGEYKGSKIKYASNQVAPSAPVFPAQFVVLIEMGNPELAKELGTNLHLVSSAKAEEVACFWLDPARIFPDHKIFEEITPNDRALSDSGKCYAAKALLDGILE